MAVLIHPTCVQEMCLLVRRAASEADMQKSEPQLHSSVAMPPPRDGMTGCVKLGCVCVSVDRPQLEFEFSLPGGQ